MSRAAIIAVLLTACIDTGVASTTTAGIQPTTTIPGVEVESSLEPGDRLGLISAEKDSTHRLASAPGGADGGPELLPTEDGLVAVGAARQVGDVLWERMRVDGREGYIARQMLAFIGQPEDVTHLYEGVTAATVADLGAEIAVEIEAARLVLIAQPGPTEVVYDVIGMEDDSVAGFRVRIVAAEAGAGFTPTLVERTPLCSRGISSEGLCL